MLAGLKFPKLPSQVAILEMHLSSTGSGSFTSPDELGMDCELEWTFTPDYIVQTLGIRLRATAATGGSVYGAVGRNYELKFNGSTYTATRSGFGNLAQTFDLVGVQLFLETGGSFKLSWTSGVWKVGGTTEATIAAGSVTSGMVPTPSSVPLIGVPPWLRGGIGNAISTPDRANLYPPDMSSEPGYSASGSATITGGWRWNVDGVYIAPNVNILSATPSGSIDIGSVEVDTTWAGTITSSFDKVTGGGNADEKTTGAAVQLMPCENPLLVRMGADYEAIVRRQAFPQTQYSLAYSLLKWGLTTGFPSIQAYIPITVSNSQPVLHASQSDFLEGVTTATGTSEALLSETTYAPFVRVGDRHVIVNLGDETRETRQVSYGTEPTYIGSDSTWRTHAEHGPRLWNTWGNRLNAFGLWFPPDFSSSSVRWDLLGAESDIAYWYDIRQQHATHPSLPSGQNTLRRLNVTTEPINQSAIVGVAEATLGLPCWWGINGFSVENETFPTEFTTNSTSAARFTFKNGTSSGTGSVGANIVIDAGSDAVEFDTSSFTVFPFMTTTLADRLKAVWSDSNIGAVKAFAIGADGTSVQIGPTAGITSGETYRIPSGNSDDWATSAGADFGVGYLTDDYTPDSGVAGSNETFATLADEERISSFGLLPGFSPVKIRFEITRAGSYTGAVTIGHPTFYMAPWADAKVFHESGLVSTILFKNGPMVRYGALSFYDWIADAPISVPNPIASVTNKTTIGDLWCWENVFLRGQSALTGLLARMEAEFVEDEEFPAGVTKHLWRYNDGESMFIDSLSGVVNSSIGPRLWYLNTFRNCPPLAMFPEKKRATGNGWLATGDWGQFAYSDISNKHPHIVPGNVLPQLIHGGTNHLAFEASPEGWSVGTFSEAVDNNESQDWELRWNETTWFSMRPWRGQASIFGMSGMGESVMSFDVDHNSHIHVLATLTDSGKVKIGIAGNPLAWEYVTTTIDASWVCCRIDRDSPDQAILLVVEDAGSVKLYKSVDRAETFTLSRTVTSSGTPKKPAILVGRNGVRQMYWIDGTDVKGQIADRADNIIESTFTAVTGVEDKGVAVDEDVTETGKKRTLLYVVQGGALTELKSDDGKTFS
jgi:hypothetical protein